MGYGEYYFTKAQRAKELVDSIEALVSGFWTPTIITGGGPVGGLEARNDAVRRQAGRNVPEEFQKCVTELRSIMAELLAG